MRVRKGSWAESSETRWANERNEPQSLLYLFEIEKLASVDGLHDDDDDLLVVILSVLNVISTHYSDFTEIGILFPLKATQPRKEEKKKTRHLR